MAGIYKRGNKWGAIFYVNGEKKRTSTGIEIIPSDGRTAIRNKKLAQQVADTMEMHAKKQASGATLAASLRALANTLEDTPSLTSREYLENYPPSGRDQNQLNSQRAIKLFLKYLRAHKLDSFALSDIKRKHCEEFLGERIQEVAEGTVRTYRSHLSAAFNRAVAEELINRNPFEHVNMGDVVNRYSAELKGRDKTERETFTVEEMRTILFDLPQPYRDLAAVSYYSGGQRIVDCITLTWDQVDFKNNLIHFCTEKTAKKLAHPLMPELRSRLLARKKLSTDPNERRVFPALDEARKRSSGLVSTQFTNLLRAYGIIKEKPAEVKKGRRRAVCDICHPMCAISCDIYPIKCDICRGRLLLQAQFITAKC